MLFHQNQTLINPCLTRTPRTTKGTSLCVSQSQCSCLRKKNLNQSGKLPGKAPAVRREQGGPGLHKGERAGSPDRQGATGRRPPHGGGCESRGNQRKKGSEGRRRGGGCTGKSRNAEAAQGCPQREKVRRQKGRSEGQKEKNLGSNDCGEKASKAKGRQRGTLF